MTPFDQFKANLTKAMDLRGIKAKTLSRQAGLGETAVRDILKLDREPTFSTIIKLAHGLNTTASELLTGVQEAYAPTPDPITQSLTDTIKATIETKHPKASAVSMGDKIVIEDGSGTRHVITIEKQ